MSNVTKEENQTIIDILSEAGLSISENLTPHNMAKAIYENYSVCSRQKIIYVLCKLSCASKHPDYLLEAISFMMSFINNHSLSDQDIQGSFLAIANALKDIPYDGPTGKVIIKNVMLLIVSALPVSNVNSLISAIRNNNQLTSIEKNMLAICECNDNFNLTLCKKQIKANYSKKYQSDTYHLLLAIANLRISQVYMPKNCKELSNHDSKMAVNIFMKYQQKAIIHIRNMDEIGIYAQALQNSLVNNKKVIIQSDPCDNVINFSYDTFSN